ncbi:MAG: hypothetical protein KGL39_04520 [Patescibacteria group bacterium]|nr:hypothetical protein [Patescibacteria group bacterium]
MAINLASIRDMLLPGLMSLPGRYDAIEKEWPQLFETRDSNMAQESAVATAYLPLAQLKTEGGPTSFDNNAGEFYRVNFVHAEVGLGYAITRKAIDDNLYKQQFQPSNLGLAFSFNQFKEINGASVLNGATSTSSSFQSGGDGQALCSTSHPTQQGGGITIANRPTVDQDLGEGALLNAMIAIRTNWRDNRGLKILGRAKKLVVPTSLEPIAIRLTKTDLRPGTGNNDVNAILTTSGGIPEGYMVNDYLTSVYAWFLLTNIPGLIHLKRKAFEVDMQVDFITDNLLVKGYERYSFGYEDFRAIYGSFPTS